MEGGKTMVVAVAATNRTLAQMEQVSAAEVCKKLGCTYTSCTVYKG